MSRVKHDCRVQELTRRAASDGQWLLAEKSAGAPSAAACLRENQKFGKLKSGNVKSFNPFPCQLVRISAFQRFNVLALQFSAFL
jgi:hypothetical protein